MMLKQTLFTGIIAMAIASNVTMAKGDSNSEGKRQHDRVSVEKREAFHTQLAEKLEAKCGARLNWDASPEAMHKQRNCAKNVMESMREKHKAAQAERKENHQEMRKEKHSEYQRSTGG